MAFLFKIVLCGLNLTQGVECRTRLELVYHQPEMTFRAYQCPCCQKLEDTCLYKCIALRTFHSRLLLLAVAAYIIVCHHFLLPYFHPHLPSEGYLLSGAAGLTARQAYQPVASLPLLSYWLQGSAAVLRS